MNRFRTWMTAIAALFVLATAALVAGALGCGGSSSSASVPPVTGILIRAETVTSGRGCGTADGQVYKYAALVFGEDPFGSNENPIQPGIFAPSFNAPVTGAVYDCFTDGTFVELPVVNGSLSFRLEIYTFNERGFTANADKINAAGQSFGIGVDGTVSATTLENLRESSPTWSTTCSATQQQDVQVLAVCAPFQPGTGGVIPNQPLASVTLATESFAIEGGGSFTCSPQVTSDGGTDSGASDAGDAGTPAPTSSSFSQVSVRAIVGGNVVLATQTGCSLPIVIRPAIVPARYAFEVILRDAQGVAIGATECNADSKSGIDTPAVCSPVVLR